MLDYLLAEENMMHLINCIMILNLRGVSSLLSIGRE